MEPSDSSATKHSSAVKQPGHLPPSESQGPLNPTQGLLQDRARLFSLANERSPSPTFDEFRPDVPHAHAWNMLRRSMNARCTERWEHVDDLLKEADESVRAAQELLQPDQRREPKVQLEDADGWSCSLEETDLWIEKAQKKLEEQARAIQPPSFKIWSIFRIAALSERRTWSVGLGRRIGYQLSTKTMVDTSRQQGSHMTGTL